MSTRISRYYYVNEETKQVIHFGQQQTPTPDSCVFAGMSQLPIKGAAGYYTKNQPGYTIVNGDELQQGTQENGQEASSTEV